MTPAVRMWVRRVPRRAAWFAEGLTRGRRAGQGDLNAALASASREMLRNGSDGQKSLGDRFEQSVFTGLLF